MSYYLTGGFYEEEILIPLEATSMDAALDEATHRLVENAFLDGAACFETLREARVIEVSDERPIDWKECESLYLVADVRKREQQAAWDKAYESIRDELGHWRTLHARGQCPHEQVSLMEDRLQAHLATKP